MLSPFRTSSHSISDSALTEFDRRDSIYNGLRRLHTAMEKMTSRNYTFRSLAGRSMRVRLSHFLEGLESRCRVKLSRQYAGATTMCDINISANGRYQVPFILRPMLRQVFGRLVFF